MAYVCAICGDRYTFGAVNPPETCECGMEFGKERIPFEPDYYAKLTAWWRRSKGLTKQQALDFWQAEF